MTEYICCVVSPPKALQIPLVAGRIFVDRHCADAVRIRDSQCFDHFCLAFVDNLGFLLLVQVPPNCIMAAARQDTAINTTAG